MERERKDNPDLKIPKFIGDIIYQLKSRGVQVEGILRQVGRHEVVSDLKHQIDRGVEVDVSGIAVHDLSSLLKKYLNELPEPLLTFDLFQSLIAKGLLLTFNFS